MYSFTIVLTFLMFFTSVVSSLLFIYGLLTYISGTEINNISVYRFVCKLVGVNPDASEYDKPISLQNDELLMTMIFLIVPGANLFMLFVWGASFMVKKIGNYLVALHNKNKKEIEE